MRIVDVTGQTIQLIAEVVTGQPVKPLTPAESRTRAKKKQKAQDRVTDIRAQAQIKVNTAIRAASEV